MSTDQETNLQNYIDRLNQNANDFEAAVMLGNAYYDSGDQAQAILYYRVALDIDPKQPGVITDMATMYWRNDNVSLAEQAYRHVIEHYPGFGNAYLNLGLLLMHGKGEVKQAREIWQVLLDNYPDEAACERIRELINESYQ